MLVGEAGWILCGGVVMLASDEDRVDGRDQDPLGGVLGTE